MQMTVQYVNPPKNLSAKYGNIKSTAGETVMVPIAMLPLFQGCEGQAVDVPTKVATWGQGAEAKTVTIATAGPGASQGGWQGAQRVPQQPAPQQQYQPPPQQQAVYQPGSTGQPTPAYRPPAADKDARAIFVTGIVGRAMGSGKFTASEIMVLTQAAAEAFDRYLDPNKPKPALPAPAAEPPFNDEPAHMLEPDGRAQSDGATVLLIGPETRRAACELVQQAPQGWMVRIGEPPRTLEQSSRFWATCRDVARSGATWDGERQTKQGWHDLFLSAWLVATRQRSPRLMLGLEGERVCLIPHSRDLSEREMSEVLDYIGAWCATHGIPLKED